jgi:hypothetical protein
MMLDNFTKHISHPNGGARRFLKQSTLAVATKPISWQAISLHAQ